MASLTPLNYELGRHLNGLHQTKPTQWEALCPTHDDENSSLCLGIGEVEPGCLTCGENCLYSGGCGYCRPDYRDSFIRLWDELNSARGFTWESNPWVWRVEFKVLKGSE